MRTLRPLVPLAAVLALTAFAVWGPPRITVTETKGSPITPGAVLEILAEHHTDEEKPQVTGRAIRQQGSERVTKDLTLTAATAKGRYGVAKQWDAGNAWVLVFTIKQGDHGEHGTAESLVKVDATGRVVGIETPGGVNARGDRFPRALTEREVDQALRSLQGSQR
jgi:hypothetical protein